VKLWRDFGVSALALTIILATMAGGAFMLLRAGKFELAVAWTVALGVQAKPFYDGYLQKRKEEQANGNGGNGKPPEGGQP